MKTICGFGVAVVTVSLALLQPAEARPRGGSGGGRSFSGGHHVSAPTARYSGGPRISSRSGANYYRQSPRVSSRSRAVNRNRVYSAASQKYAVNRRTALRPNGSNISRQRLAATNRAALRAKGFDSQGRVTAAASRNWDRNRDHYWNGHRCHWRNNSWVIIDPWFLYPWAYGYGYGYPYGYGAYSYYNDRYYEDVYQPAGYSEYEDGDASVSQVQSALARKGYYRGAIDGSFGPETSSAVRQYQRNHGLTVTGQIDGAVLDALRLR